MARREPGGPSRPAGASELEGRDPVPSDLVRRVWPPMLATLARAEEVTGEGWHLEVKYDGFRALAGLSAGSVSLQSRTGLDLSGRFPAVARALPGVRAREAVLDGEVVALDVHGVSHFQDLQASSARPCYAVFDLLWQDGEDLRSKPIEERRGLLQKVLAGAPHEVEATRVVEGPVERALARARRAGWEGIVAKRAGSRYRGGRSRDWLKVKMAANQELAIAGYTPVSTGAEAIGALLVAFAEGGRLRYAGKVGTGYTEGVRRRLWGLLERDRVAAPQVEGAPRMREARWVRPRLVAQIAFAEWTADGRLRQPSFQGLRHDKRPEECVREQL
jgi:bifunctional non-homologous end joining protein LigD